MLYALRSQPINPFPVRDRPRSGYAAFPGDLYHDRPRFLDDLREFICLRLDKVNPYKASKEYCLQQEQAARLYEKLKEMLPEEGRTMLQQYSEALGAAHCLEVSMLAERAFLDGVRLIVAALDRECRANEP